MRYALVTGASSGIGEEFAKQLAAKNHPLILVARSEDKLEELAKNLRKRNGVDIQVIAQDLGHLNSAEKLFEQCKKKNLNINFLVNDAGIGLIGKFDKFSIDKIDEMLVLNVITLTKLCYLFFPDLKKSKGTIINLASQVAFTAGPYMSSYAATKAYVLSFTEGIREEYKDEGIHILSLCPGPTYTRFFERTNATPNDIQFKFRPPKDVVDEAFSALSKNKSTTVVGWENKLMTFMFRFLPRSLTAKMSAYMVKDGEHKPKKGNHI